MLCIQPNFSLPVYSMVYVQCVVDFITRNPKSRLHHRLSRQSCLTLGSRSQFPSIIEQIYDTPSGPSLGWRLCFVSNYQTPTMERLTESPQNSPFLFVSSVNPAQGDSWMAFLQPCNLLVIC